MTERECLTFGALLHDIGKFAIRGEEILKKEYENLKEIYCPCLPTQKYTHIHLLYSGQFIEDLFKNTNPLVSNLVLSHHLPEKCQNVKLAKIVQIADWLSSGEREERQDEEEKIKFKKEPMISIFSQLTIDNKKSEEFFNKPVKINGDLENLMPVKKEFAIDDEHNFEKLWNEFKNESKYVNLNLSSYKKIFLQIFSLLEKYTIFVPSASVRDKPEISLFHHLKSTCAIATCLYDLNKDENEIDEIIKSLKNIFEGREEDEKVLTKNDFILLKGDISGIQDFIYSVTTEKALKGLRGRSFYLQLISEIIANRILDEFDLTCVNLMYLGGGGFAILLPNLEDIKSKIENLAKEIDEVIFKSHKGKLGIVVASSEFSYFDFISNFKEIFAKIGEKLVIEKRRKFRHILSSEIFKPYPEKIDKEMSGCEICGEEIENGEKCGLCESFERLASEIKTTNLIVMRKINNSVKIPVQVKDWSEIFKSLGYEIHFKDLNGGIKFSINNSDFLKNNCDGFRFEAIYSPEGTLEDLCKKAVGIKKWGVLKMDVDKLGEIFKTGIKNLTISRYNMLSYAFSLFFSLGIRYIVEKYHKNRCCVVYSGGDDLFIIAPWSDVPDIAETIYKKFREYTCEHPQITISGGIFIAPSSGFPVYRAALECGQAEEKAKTGEKNKITFLGTDLKWDEEFKKVKKVKDKLYELLSNNVSRSILTILYSGYKEQGKKARIPFVRIWRLFYALKRFMERHSGYESKIENIRKEFIINNFDLKEKLDVAVKWTDLLTRKENKRGGET